MRHKVLSDIRNSDVHFRARRFSEMPFCPVRFSLLNHPMVGQLDLTESSAWAKPHGGYCVSIPHISFSPNNKADSVWLIRLQYNQQPSTRVFALALVTIFGFEVRGFWIFIEILSFVRRSQPIMIFNILFRLQCNGSELWIHKTVDVLM